MLLLLAFIITIISIVAAAIEEKISYLFMNIISLILVFVHITGISILVGEGNHTGYITAIDTSGFFIKSTTVYFKTDVNSSQEDRYCILDKSLIPELQKSQKERKNVTIHYIDNLSNGAVCKVGTEIITSISYENGK